MRDDPAVRVTVLTGLLTLSLAIGGTLGAQTSRVGVPGRVDYNPYFGVALADPELRAVLGSRDPQFLLDVIRETITRAGGGELGASGRPVELGILAADRLAALKAYDVADSLLKLGVVLAGTTNSGALDNPQAPIAFGIQHYRYAFEFRTLSSGETIHRMLDSVSRLPTVTSAELEYLADLSPESADSARDRFLGATSARDRTVYLEVLMTTGAPASIPILAGILAHGEQAFGPVGGFEDRVAAGLLRVGTLSALTALRDGLATAESLGTYRAIQTQHGYDPVTLWRTKLIPDLTGHTLDEWIDSLSRPTAPPPVVAQMIPSPATWNLKWRTGGPTGQERVSFELGNIAGGRDPRTLARESIRLNGTVAPIVLPPHNVGNARWTGPWVDIVFRQLDVIALVPLDAKPGDTFLATLTGTLADGTHITAQATVRLVRE